MIQLKKGPKYESQQVRERVVRYRSGVRQNSVTMPTLMNFNMIWLLNMTTYLNYRYVHIYIQTGKRSVHTSLPRPLSSTSSFIFPRGQCLRYCVFEGLLYISYFSLSFIKSSQDIYYFIYIVEIFLKSFKAFMHYFSSCKQRKFIVKRFCSSFSVFKYITI